MMRKFFRLSVVLIAVVLLSGVFLIAGKTPEEKPAEKPAVEEPVMRTGSQKERAEALASQDE